MPESDVAPHSLNVMCRANSDTKQESNMEQFIFDVNKLVPYISDAMTLRPGDVISTGTPGDVGVFRNSPEFLLLSDEVEVEGHRDAHQSRDGGGMRV